MNFKSSSVQEYWPYKLSSNLARKCLNGEHQSTQNAKWIKMCLLSFRLSACWQVTFLFILIPAWMHRAIRTNESGNRRKPFGNPYIVATQLSQSTFFLMLNQGNAKNLRALSWLVLNMTLLPFHAIPTFQVLPFQVLLVNIC